MPADSTLLRRARRLATLGALTVASVPLAAALAPGSASAAFDGQLVLNNAASHTGQPYVYGATGPSAFDCSGLTGYVYRQFGVDLPRTAADQYNAVQHVAKADAEVGDLIFTYDGTGIYHVGIYAGGMTMFAATHTGDVVRPQTIWTPSYVVGRPSLGGGIGAAWQSLGGSRSPLGQALGLEHAVPGAQKVDFQNGDIYWTPPTGAQPVIGGIAARYDAVGTTVSALGVPTTGEMGTAGGRMNRFRGGAIYWSPQLGGKVVQGGINQKFDALGGSWGTLGMPVGDESGVPGGRASSFQRGQITWSPSTGAVATYGAIDATYRALGGSGGVLGLPVSDEQAAPGGRQSVFQHGVLRWDAATGRVTRL